MVELGTGRSGERVMGIRRKVAAVALATIVATGVTAGVAGAGQPVVKGCVGDTFSANRDVAGPFGQVIRNFAQDPNNRPGLGDGIQAVQAGVVPDDVANNACN